MSKVLGGKGGEVGKMRVERGWRTLTKSNLFESHNSKDLKIAISHVAIYRETSGIF